MKQQVNKHNNKYNLGKKKTLKRLQSKDNESQMINTPGIKYKVNPN